MIFSQSSYQFLLARDLTCQRERVLSQTLHQRRKRSAGRRCAAGGKTIIAAGQKEDFGQIQTGNNEGDKRSKGEADLSRAHLPFGKGAQETQVMARRPILVQPLVQELI